MQSIDRILVGVDLVDGRVGPTATLAITQARAVAEASGARVSLLHSIHGDEHWDRETSSFEIDVTTREDEARQILEKAAAPFREAGITCETLITDSPTGLAIVRHVLRDRTDLVFIGKRASDDQDRRLMGSVSLNVVRHCPCLVSVVKPMSDPRPKVIVAATDGGPVGAAVVSAAAGMATLFGSVLHGIHAIQLGMEVQLSGAEAEREFVAARRDEVRATIEAEASAAGFEGELHIHAGLTSPTRGVLEAVARLQPDLVVMGTISRGGIPGLLVGNTAERLLGTLDCSLLVAKPDDFVCPVTVD